jgi:hypothetical protein
MGSKYNAVICNECNNELEVQEHDLGNVDVLYVSPCKNCSDNIKEDYSGELNFLRTYYTNESDELKNLRRQNSILINFFWKINKDLPNTENLTDELIDIGDKINFLNCLGPDIETVKKRFDVLDILEPIINKIIPEYQDIPLEYKVLLLKERMKNQFIITPEFGFNEDQINQLAEALIISKIHLIKKLRELTGLGLKEAKDYIESKISSFDIKISFPEAKKIILEKF